jgi:hypothetical protein
LAGPDAFVRGKTDRQRLHGIFHVPRQVDVLKDRAGHVGLLALAQVLVAGFVGHRQVLIGLADTVDADRAGLGVGVVVVGLGAFGIRIETAPLGDTTSFTKKAVSDIIGPQPASYHPRLPSSNSTWKWP